MQEAQERIQRDMATKGTARAQDVFRILGEPAVGVGSHTFEAQSTVALGTVCGTSLHQSCTQSTTAYMDTPHYRVNKFAAAVHCMPGAVIVASRLGLQLALEDLEAVVRDSAPLYTGERHQVSNEPHITDEALTRWAELCEKGHGQTVAEEIRWALKSKSRLVAGNEPSPYLFRCHGCGASMNNVATQTHVCHAIRKKP